MSEFGSTPLKASGFRAKTLRTDSIIEGSGLSSRIFNATSAEDT